MLLRERGFALVKLPFAGLELLPQDLPGHQFLFARLELRSQPVELGALRLLEILLALLEISLLGDDRLLAAFDLGEVCSQLFPLRLVEPQLRFALLQISFLGDERLLAALDLGEACAQLMNLGAGRCELLLELTGVRTNSLLAVLDVSLASPERGVLGGDPRAFLGQALLAVREP